MIVPLAGAERCCSRKTYSYPGTQSNSLTGYRPIIPSWTAYIPSSVVCYWVSDRSIEVSDLD